MEPVPPTFPAVNTVVAVPLTVLETTGFTVPRVGANWTTVPSGIIPPAATGLPGAEVRVRSAVIWTSSPARAEVLAADTPSTSQGETTTLSGVGLTELHGLPGPPLQPHQLFRASIVLLSPRRLTPYELPVIALKLAVTLALEFDGKLMPLRKPEM